MNKQSLIIIILFFLVNTLIAQTDSECGCEWDGNVTPELSVPPCEYTDNREDDSYRTYAAYACCMEKCKEKIEKKRTIERKRKELETEKTKKQKDINNKNPQIKQLESKETENERLKDGMDFIDKQNKEIADMEKSFQKIESTFSEISNNWAKEKQFQTRLASYTSINSTDPKRIIKEAKKKSQEINTTFSQRKNELLNEGTAATQKIIGAAKTEEQVIGGAIIGTGLTVLGQLNAEKERKKAQQKLEAEKEAALIKLTQPIIDKYKPIAEQNFKIASLSVYEDKESYYLEQYKYSRCMIDNAYNIITTNYSCTMPITKVFKKRENILGEDYYKAYERKKTSSFVGMNNASETFLELAIEKEPNNAEWIYEKSLSKKITPEVKLSILNRTLEIEPNNQIYISEMLKTKELVDKRRRVDLEKEKRIDSKPFMILKDVPIFPGCKKKNKACFNTKINEHFNKELNSKIFKEKNIKRLFLNLIITEKGEFIYVNTRDYDRIVISEIERVINLLPKLEPTYLNKKAIAIGYTLPLRIK